MISKYGLADSNAAWSPPTMNVNVAFSAPGFDPVHGASKNCAPLAVNAAPISFDTAGAMVLQSAVTLPLRTPSISPPAPVVIFRAEIGAAFTAKGAQFLDAP